MKLATEVVEVKNNPIPIRLTPTQAAWVKIKSDEANRTTSDFIRHLLLQHGMPKSKRKTTRRKRRILHDESC